MKISQLFFTLTIAVTLSVANAAFSQANSHDQNHDREVNTVHDRTEQDEHNEPNHGHEDRDARLRPRFEMMGSRRKRS